MFAKAHSLFYLELFPVLTSREFEQKAPKSLGFECHLLGEAAPELQISLFFSLLAGNCDAETGSIATASATTHSYENAQFPKMAKYPRIGAFFSQSSSLLRDKFLPKAEFWRGVSGPEILVPGNRLIFG